MLNIHKTCEGNERYFNECQHNNLPSSDKCIQAAVSCSKRSSKEIQCSVASLYNHLSVYIDETRCAEPSETLASNSLTFTRCAIIIYTNRLGYYYCSPQARVINCTKLFMFPATGSVQCTSQLLPYVMVL